MYILTFLSFFYLFITSLPSLFLVYRPTLDVLSRLSNITSPHLRRYLLTLIFLSFPSVVVVTWCSNYVLPSPVFYFLTVLFSVATPSDTLVTYGRRPSFLIRSSRARFCAGLHLLSSIIAVHLFSYSRSLSSPRTRSMLSLSPFLPTPSYQLPRPLLFCIPQLLLVFTPTYLNYYNMYLRCFLLLIIIIRGPSSSLLLFTFTWQGSQKILVQALSGNDQQF